MAKTKLTSEQKLQQDFEYRLANVKHAENTESYHSTFWWKQMHEIMPYWKEYLEQHPDELDTVLMGFAWHAYYKALTMR